jgi:hypothetical protein
LPGLAIPGAIRHLLTISTPDQTTARDPRMIVPSDPVRLEIAPNLHQVWEKQNPQTSAFDHPKGA